MKLGILADCHLGVNKFRKIKDFQNAYCTLNNVLFEEAIDYYIKSKINCLAIAGDLFEVPNPDIMAITIAMKAFKKLEENNIDVYILGGNHDYSQRLNAAGYHAFDVFKDCKNVKTITDDVKSYLLQDDVQLICAPYKTLNEGETYKKINDFKESNSNSKNILMIHGYVALEEEEADEDSLYYLNRRAIQGIDLTICGHIHLQRLIETKSFKILTPGSLMPPHSVDEKFSSYAWIYDTEKNKVTQKKLKNSPEIFQRFIKDKLELDTFLEEISNDKNASKNFYFIRYNGNVEDIDEYLYRKALESGLVLSLTTQEMDILDTEDEEYSSQNPSAMEFWNWIKENHPEYYEEFLENINKED